MTRAAGYATYTEADAYFAGDPDAAEWLALAVTATKTALLLKASDAIDRQLLKGAKADAVQGRAFPRTMDRTTQVGVPQAVIDACCEEANEMLKQLGSPRLNLQRSGVSSVGYSGSSESYRVGSGKGLISRAAKELMKFYLLGAV